MTIFIGCEQLDYDEKKYSLCSLEHRTDGVKFWIRPTYNEDIPSHVQFCKLRGRLNHWEACTQEKYKQCNDYKELIK